MSPVTRRTAARVALVAVALGQLQVGLWGELSPHGFYANFPGFGHHWVSAMGAYDEHLIRDYAGAEIGFAVMLVLAAWWFERRVVLLAGAAFLAGTLPHFIYHLTTTAMLSTTDNVTSIGAFVAELAAVAVVMLAALNDKEQTQWPASNLAASAASTSSAG